MTSNILFSFVVTIVILIIAIFLYIIAMLSIQTFGVAHTVILFGTFLVIWFFIYEFVSEQRNKV